MSLTITGCSAVGHAEARAASSAIRALAIGTWDCTFHMAYSADQKAELQVSGAGRFRLRAAHEPPDSDPYAPFVGYWRLDGLNLALTVPQDGDEGTDYSQLLVHGDQDPPTRFWARNPNRDSPVVNWHIRVARNSVILTRARGSFPVTKADLETKIQCQKRSNQVPSIPTPTIDPAEQQRVGQKVPQPPTTLPPPTEPGRGGLLFSIDSDSSAQAKQFVLLEGGAVLMVSRAYDINEPVHFLIHHIRREAAQQALDLLAADGRLPTADRAVAFTSRDPLADKVRHLLTSSSTRLDRDKEWYPSRLIVTGYAPDRGIWPNPMDWPFAWSWARISQGKGTACLRGADARRFWQAATAPDVWTTPMSANDGTTQIVFSQFEPDYPGGPFFDPGDPSLVRC